MTGHHRTGSRPGVQLPAARALGWLCGLGLLAGCQKTPEDTGSGWVAPTQTAAEMVVPSAGLPAEVIPQDANNNLDIAWHEDRLYLAFRTAPSHFASELAELYVISTTDEQSWRFEGRFHHGTDLREPRLLSHDGSLFLFFALLGSDAMAFEPGSSRVSQLIAPGEWTEPVPFIDVEGFIPWRLRMWQGKPTMVGYTGGENIYELDGEPLEVYWLQSDDGWNWEPVVPDQPVVTRGGASETDFVGLDDGGIVAVQRNEAGDEQGWGSKICRAEAGDLGTWTCVPDPRKYDSPLMFREAGEAWLVARRNLTESGAYDLGMDELSTTEQTIQYQLDYWQHPKRCSLWHIDPEALVSTFVLDLPSRGDTCFPGEVELGDGDHLIYNYSSPLDGPDIDWLTGQLGLTSIYRLELHF